METENQKHTYERKASSVIEYAAGTDVQVSDAAATCHHVQSEGVAGSAVEGGSTVHCAAAEASSCPMTTAKKESFMTSRRKLNLKG
jgi:hypothetical protein